MASIFGTRSVMPLFIATLACGILLAFGFISKSHAADMLNVPQHIYDGLTADQRKVLGDRYTVNVLEGKSYGLIIDSQGLNESTRGTTAGSQLGSRVASAAYVDNAFAGSPRNWNYSASGHLAAQLAGAVIGSMADKPGEARYRTRYTIKTGVGGVEYVEENRSDALRHFVGICVTTRPIKPIEFDTCNQTREQFLSKFAVLFPSSQVPQTVAQPNSASAAMAPPPAPMPSPAVPIQQSATVADDIIQCKIGLSSPVRVSTSVCDSAGGVTIR
jgi:hypothetical protein